MRFSASSLPTSARFSCRRSLWSLRALNTVVSSGPKWRAKSSWLSSSNSWSGKTRTAYLVKAARMAARSWASIGLPSATSPTSAAKAGGVGWTVMATEPSWVLPILCLAVIGPLNGPACKWREGVPAGETFMMRLTVWFGAFIALMLGLAAAQAAPLDNRDGFWSDWSDATFARAASEKKFVIVSLQSWWCPWCHVMNRDTWADADVRAVLKEKFIPLQGDQDSRPDISQRYGRWGCPATIIFGPDGTEIVKLRGFYSPKFFIPILQETIRDPSPVDYGNPGGPERERTLATDR